MRLQYFSAAACLLIGGLASSTTALSDEPQEQLVERGRYIAQATDCIACHIGPDGTPYAGGQANRTPLGDIVAPNISSSEEYGIGSYSLSDLTRVLREGKAPGGKHLYPAMPYPSYQGMMDEDIEALYAYLQSVPAVDRAPEAETDLSFPFNVRLSMTVWNAINLGEYAPPEGLDDREARGQYIVDHMAHCGTCHTPRDDMMGSDYDQYLGGAQLGRWYAPNITSDDTSGIGAWSHQQLADYLKHGQAGYLAQAAGPMGEAVHHSLQYLTEDDRMAIAAYLKAVPAISDEKQQHAVFDPELGVPLAQLEPVVIKATDYRSDELEENGLKSNDIEEPSSPEGLYAQHCAACHRDDGMGQPDSHYASLKGNTTVRSANPRNLIAVVLEGISYNGATPRPLMPGFEGKLDDQEVADIANFVRTEFGEHSSSNIEEDDVAYIASGKQPTSTLIRFAPVLAWAGVLIILLLIVGGIWTWRRRRHQRSHTESRPEAHS
ncbi:cytochrome c [Halomonas halodenitrificans]|uniref:cytochrome c n=1 Tax=Halomonas halodenitrificans TaxID=28252 RepID=UPI0009FDB12B|nr:cytochrome c [Halomonas halodenitrificans]